MLRLPFGIIEVPLFRDSLFLDAGGATGSIHVDFILALHTSLA